MEGVLWNIQHYLSVGYYASYRYEAIHDGCVVAFTGAYEIVIDNQTRRVDVDKGYYTWLLCEIFNMVH